MSCCHPHKYVFRIRLYIRRPYPEFDFRQHSAPRASELKFRFACRLNFAVFPTDAFNRVNLFEPHAPSFSPFKWNWVLMKSTPARLAKSGVAKHSRSACEAFWERERSGRGYFPKPGGCMALCARGAAPHKRLPKSLKDGRASDSLEIAEFDRHN